MEAWSAGREAQRRRQGREQRTMGARV